MHILAPAKVNLFLRIVGQRPDGYHFLDSLMAPVSLYDEIEMTAERREETRPNISLRCDDPAIPADQSNLAYRAAALLCQEAGVGADIDIRLHKNIPSGAGLGGGSSDAAAVLKGLNQLLSLGFSTDHLCSLATRLGADVPFFVPCQLARVGGIGEVLTLLQPLPQRWLVIVVPAFSVSTPWAYQRFDELQPTNPGLDRESRAPELEPHQWPDTVLFVNDLERAVLPEYPLLRERKEQLLALGAEVALMSGSGCSVFAVFANQKTAAQAVGGMKASAGETEDVFIVTIVEENPAVK